MLNVLRELNEEVGIKGSMVITPDGILVASALGPDLEEELVAAIISSIIVSVNRTVSKIGMPDEPNSCVLVSESGKIMFYNMGASFLVVVADGQIKIDTCVIAIRSAMMRIGNRKAS